MASDEGKFLTWINNFKELYKIYQKNKFLVICLIIHSITFYFKVLKLIYLNIRINIGISS